jgi:hypothetical protein
VVFYFGKIFKWFFILEKILSGFLFWKNYQVVFYFGKKIMWFFHLEPTICDKTVHCTRHLYGF